METGDQMMVGMRQMSRKEPKKMDTSVYLKKAMACLEDLDETQLRELANAVADKLEGMDTSDQEPDATDSGETKEMSPEDGDYEINKEVES